MADVDDLWHRADGSPTARCGQGRRWQARWRDPAGKQRSRSFARKLDAERHLAAVTADMARGSYIDPAAGRITVGEFARGWVAGLPGGPTTREAVQGRLRLHILPQLGEVELGKLRPSMVSAWLAGRRKVLSDGYAREVGKTLAAICSSAVEDGLIAASPCRTTRLPASPQRTVVPWTAERVAAVTLDIAPGYRSFVLCGAGEGLRQGELLGLAAEDIDFLRRVIHVRRQVRIVGGALVFAPPKGGKSRDVPLADTVGLALSFECVASSRPVCAILPWEVPGGRLVTANLLWTRRGKPWHRSAFNSEIWRPALKAAGVTPGHDTGCHALRHYAASAWLAGGVSIRAVAAYLGHADAGFTLRTYTHLMPDGDDQMRAAAGAALASCATDVQPGPALVQN